MNSELIKGHLDLLALTILARGPLHGYAVVAALREQSGGEFELPEGTVYPALHRLERASFVASEWSEQGGRRRRVYGITAKGRTALADLNADYQRFSAGIRAILEGA